MARKQYLILFAILIVLVVLSTENDIYRSSTIQNYTYLIVGILAWGLIWMRLAFLKKRPELSTIPALPLLVPAINGFFFHTNPGSTANMPGFHIIMVLSLLITAGIISLTFVPDEVKPGTKRIDSVSIVSSTFICYFCLSLSAGHFRLLFESL